MTTADLRTGATAVVRRCASAVLKALVVWNALEWKNFGVQSGAWNSPVRCGMLKILGVVFASGLLAGAESGARIQHAGEVEAAAGGVLPAFARSSSICRTVARSQFPYISSISACVPQR